MISTVGGTDRLRPHVKTHKMAEIIGMQLEAGITKFKCATLSEAELLARCNAPDILLAMQPTGPGIERFFQLQKKFPRTQFAALFDCESTLDGFSTLARSFNTTANLYLDLNTGMNRSGIVPGMEAASLYIKAAGMEGLKTKGLHAYDGHLRQSSFEERKAASDKAFRGVEKLKHLIIENRLPEPYIIAGGSPTFPVHALRENVECSPGTTLLWDERYRSSFPDMNYEIAALLFCRVISKPSEDLICLDLGHKSIAPEMPFPRARLLGLENSEQVSQSEEHLVVKVQDASAIKVGDPFYVRPMHICPTVAKYPSAFIVRDNKIIDEWRVAARDHLWQEEASGL